MAEIVTPATLREALLRTMHHPEEHLGFLYLPHQPWTLDTSVAFFDFDIDPNMDQTSEFIKQKGWKETLDTDLIDQVIFNAKAQKPEVDLDELLQAFTYFVNHDAFMVFEN